MERLRLACEQVVHGRIDLAGNRVANAPIMDAAIVDKRLVELEAGERVGDDA